MHGTDGGSAPVAEARLIGVRRVWLRHNAFVMVLSTIRATQKRCAAVVAAIFVISVAFAGPGQIDAKIGVSRLGAKENNTYLHYSFSKAVASGYRGELLGTFGSRKTYAGPGFNIRYGGSDVEARLHCEKNAQVQGYLGGAYVSTPAGKNRLHGVAGLQFNLANNPTGRFDLVGRMATRSKSTLIGVGFSANWQSPTYGASAEVLAVTGGPNTYNENTGIKQRRPVFRLGVNRALKDGTVLELGVTNQMGRTTGGSLTPGLGKGVGIYLEAKVKL